MFLFLFYFTNLAQIHTIQLEPGNISTELVLLATNTSILGAGERTLTTEHISDLSNFELIIPEKCKKLGICEDVPNYPHEIVSKIIENLIRRGTKFTFSREVNATSSHSVEKDKLKSLCQSKTVITYPEAARNINGKWNLILNSRIKPVQSFSGEVCTGGLNASCDQDLVDFTYNYQGICKQKEMFIEMIALDNKNNVFKDFHLVNSCCVCVAVKTSNVDYTQNT